MFVNLVSHGWLFKFLLLGSEESFGFYHSAAVNVRLSEGRVCPVFLSIQLGVELLVHAII